MDIKCDYCDNKATLIITKVMQPSWPHLSCEHCYLLLQPLYMIISEEVGVYFSGKQQGLNKV